MAFSAIVQADILQDTLEPLTALVNECKIHLDEDGLHVRAVDPANVGMVDLTLAAGACAHYEAEGGTIGVNLDRLSDVVGMADASDMVHLDLDDETRKLSIEIGGLSFTLALINPDSIRQEPDMPDLDLAGRYTITGATVDRAVTAADMVSDHIEIRGIGDALVFAAEGDTDDVTETVGDDRLLDAMHDADGPVSSLFSLDYLDDMNGAIDTDAEVAVVVGDEMPVTLRYTRAEGDVTVEYMLAPRVQSDGGGA